MKRYGGWKRSGREHLRVRGPRLGLLRVDRFLRCGQLPLNRGVGRDELGGLLQVGDRGGLLLDGELSDSTAVEGLCLLGITELALARLVHGVAVEVECGRGVLDRDARVRGGERRRRLECDERGVEVEGELEGRVLVLELEVDNGEHRVNVEVCGAGRKSA